jgi:rod shape-determining protein MreC
MIERLYKLLIEFKEYVVLSLLIVVSLVLLAFNNNQQIHHLRSIATVIVGLVQERLSFIPHYVGLRSENEMLRRMNIELADEANRLREARLENIRLRRLLSLKQETRYSLVPARVVGKDLTLLRNTITLNVGTADSIRPFMPVITDAGLVGVVTAVSRHYSVANVLLNVDFRASAKVQRSRVDGIVAWNGQNLVLKNVAKTLDVKPGDVLVTSEYSRTYPSGIRIGIVQQVQDQQGALFKTIIVEPSVDFVKLEEVFVVTLTADEDRGELEQRLYR